MSNPETAKFLVNNKLSLVETVRNGQLRFLNENDYQFVVVNNKVKVYVDSLEELETLLENKLFA